MSEIRRKLVIVGDGACGKVVPLLIVLPTQLTPLSDLSLDRLFQGHVPRGAFQQQQLPFIL